MGIKKLYLKQKVALAVILLVLVISYVAYSVYVPKLQELKNLQASLHMAEQTRTKLSVLPKPTTLTDAEKKTLAEEVPTALDQSRFIEQLREREAKSGVVIQSLTFAESGDSNKPGAGNATGSKGAPGTYTAQTAAGTSAPTATGAPALQALKEVDGNLSFEGSYSQVREFFRQMTTIPRLVTYKTWTISAKEVPIQSNPTPSITSASTSAPKTSVSTTIKTAQVALASNHVNVSPLDISLPANLPESSLPDNVLTDPLLKDRSPIYKEDEFNRVIGSIKQKNALLHTQHDLDMANLEIQQTLNRYVAGLLGQSKAETILNQDYAGHFLPGASTNIRDVLGLAPLYTPSASPLSLMQNQDVMGTQPLPEPLPETQTQSQTQSQVQSPVAVPMKTIVTVNAQFAIYYAPTAADVLPKPDAFQTYDPAQRSNPVEAQ